MLAAAALLIAMYPDWVPARWPSADPKSLELLVDSPVNCLWLERPQWSSAFAAEAAKRGIATLGVIHREGDPIEAAQALAKTGFTGGVFEGNFDDYSPHGYERNPGQSQNDVPRIRSAPPVTLRCWCTGHQHVAGTVAGHSRRKGRFSHRWSHRQPLDRYQHRISVCPGLDRCCRVGRGSTSRRSDICRAALYPGDR